MQLFPTLMFGHKKSLVAEILELVPPSAQTMAEPLSGTGVVSWHAKKAGLRVIGNDIRRFAHQQFKVLVANNDTILTEDDLAMLTRPTKVAEPWIERLFLGTYGIRNARFLDQWVANSSRLANDAKRDVAAWLPVFCSMRRIKYYAARLSPEGVVAGSQQLVLSDLAQDMIISAREILPKLVFDNGHTHQAYNEDALNLIGRIEADVAFIDTPYCCRGGDYERDLAFYDDLLRICLGRANEVANVWDGNCDLPPYTNFASRRSAITGLGQLFHRASHIPTLIVSYNTTSEITTGEIQNLAAAVGRKVTAVRKIPRPLPTNTKRATQEAYEVLLRLEPA